MFSQNLAMLTEHIDSRELSSAYGTLVNTLLFNHLSQFYRSKKFKKFNLRKRRIWHTHKHPPRHPPEPILIGANLTKTKRKADTLVIDHQGHFKCSFFEGGHLQCFFFVGGLGALMPRPRYLSELSPQLASSVNAKILNVPSTQVLPYLSLLHSTLGKIHLLIDIDIFKKCPYISI